MSSKVNSDKKKCTESKFCGLNKQLEKDFENLKVQSSTNEFSFEENFSIHRSPSPITGNLEKLDKLRGIGREIIMENRDNLFEKNVCKTLFASRNYLTHGKSFVFQ